MSACPFLHQVTVELLLDAYDRLGYRVFESGDYDLNIFGIRNHDRQNNTFNDCVGVFYPLGDSWQLHVYDATTDPGAISLTQPINERGCAILALGQHEGAFKLGYHKGKYRALVQNNALPLHRDNNGDDILDMDDEPEYEIAGINLHRANANTTSKLNNNWSAGCSVIANPQDFDEFMAIAEEAAQRYGNSFTYTLLSEEQVFGDY